MPQRNRVTPLGDIVAGRGRGAWTGNRGRLHQGLEIVRFHDGNLWITCALAFRGRWSPQWQPRHFTWLFFQDEAVSLAAGHRPCAECRYADYRAFRRGWATGLAVDLPSAAEMNQQLHGERLVRGTHRRRLHPMPWGSLPAGCFVAVDDVPCLVLDHEVVTWSTSGYGEHDTRPSSGTASVITPPSSVAVIRAGYPVQIDPSAQN